MVLFRGGPRRERVIERRGVHLRLGFVALVSPPDDGEDHERNDDDDAEQRDVRGWARVRSEEFGCDCLDDHDAPFVHAVSRAGESERICWSVVVTIAFM
jgi:hypothetical protein